MNNRFTPVGTGPPPGQQQSSTQPNAPRLNTFSNDGSFFEQFKKMQELQKQKQQQSSSQTSSTSGFSETGPTVSNKRVTKSGTVLMNLSGVKKTKEPDVKLKNPGQSAQKAFRGDGSSSESEGEEDKDNPDLSSRYTGAGDSLMTMAGYSGASTTGQSTSSLPVSATSSLKKKRRNRFSDGPPASTDDAAISHAIASFDSSSGKQELTAAQQLQLLEQIEMNKMVAEIKAATQPTSRKRPRSKNNPTYEYDSDEDVEDGTWEHKKRTQEMKQTADKAKELTVMNKGKHHIGDFLPPKEVEKFVEKVSAIKEGRTPDFSDYKEHKLTEENVGFKMLQKAGWTEGSGLGSSKEGIVDPINKGKASFDQSGVGAEPPAEVKKEDNAFDVYRKRMMLAYRFRPNPLNNPRRPYY